MVEHVPAEKRLMPSAELLRQWADSPHNGQCWGLGEIADELDELRRSLRREENARLIAVKDADRYRWIRRQKHTHIAACWIVPASVEVEPGPEAFDKAIDAAMEQQ